MPLKLRASTVIGIAASMLLLLSLATPWFQVSYEWQIVAEYRSETRFGTQDFVIRIYMSGEELANESHPYNNSYFEPVGDLMEIQILILVLAVGSSILFVLSYASRSVAVRLFLGLIALVLIFMALANIYLGIDNAFNDSGTSLVGSSELLTIEGFSGSKNVSIFGISWGPTTGWWLGLSSLVLQASSLLLVFLARAREGGC